MLDLRAEQIKRRKLLYVLRIARSNDLCKRFRKPHEVVVLGNEIRLAIELYECANFAVSCQPRADHAFGGDAPRGLACLRATLDAQQLLCFSQVAASLGQRLLAIHHGQASEFTQFLDLAGTDFRHSLLLAESRLKKRGARPLFVHMAGAYSAPSPSSSTSTNSSREAATTSSSDCVRPSSTASAIPRA